MFTLVLLHESNSIRKIECIGYHRLFKGLYLGIFEDILRKVKT